MESMKTHVVLAIFLSVSAFGQLRISSPNQTTPAGFKNGRYWRALNGGQAKVMYLTGYFDGFDKALVELYTGQNTKELDTAERENIPKATMGEVMTALDRFYSDQETLNIPIWRAIRVAALRLAGRPAHEVDAEMEPARSVVRYDLEQCEKKNLAVSISDDFVCRASFERPPDYSINKV